MQAQILDGSEAAVTKVSEHRPIAFLSANLSGAVCWAISGISALQDQPKLAISYAIAAAVLTVVGIRNNPNRPTGFKRRSR